MQSVIREQGNAALKIRCPHCDTRYQVDPGILQRAGGLAHCHRCDTVFDVTAKRSAKAWTDVASRKAAVRLSARLERHAGASEPAVAAGLPFEVPDDLEPLQASPADALSVTETLYEKKSHRDLIYGIVIAFLLVALGLQLAWQQREELFAEFPQLKPVCDYIACQPQLAHAPDRFRILQRDIRPTPNAPGSLTLSAQVRNDAELAQPFPDMQLALLDNNGVVVIRRRLAPQEYLFPAPPEERVVAPGEVITITLDFEDPGYLATGFQIDFL